MKIKKINYFFSSVVLVVLVFWFLFSKDDNSSENQLVKKEYKQNESVNQKSSSENDRAPESSDLKKDSMPKVATQKNEASGLDKQMQDTLAKSQKKLELSWESRSIYRNGIEVFYSFGNGNPNEVALSQDEIGKLPDLVRNSLNHYTTYMTPEAEWALKNFLESENLSTLLERCHNFFEVKESDLTLEKIMYIEEKTGRKEFQRSFIQAMGDGFSQLESPMQPENWKECLKDYEKSILESARQNYSNIINNYIIYERSQNGEAPIIREVVPEIMNSQPPAGYTQDNSVDYMNHQPLQ